MCMWLCTAAMTRLKIADDGRGFRPDRVGAGRFGLISMRERAASIGASLRIHSLHGHGTAITFEWREPTGGANPKPKG